jgi:hypothetical protein
MFALIGRDGYHIVFSGYVVSASLKKA